MRKKRQMMSKDERFPGNLNVLGRFHLRQRPANFALQSVKKPMSKTVGNAERSLISQFIFAVDHKSSIGSM